MSGSEPTKAPVDPVKRVSGLSSQAGAVIFLLGLLHLWWAPSDTPEAKCLPFKLAGFLVLAASVTQCRSVVPYAKKLCTEVVYPAVLFVLAFCALFLFVAILLLPFVYFVFEKLL